ncbi:hypothetical protein GCK72_020192 [Caenorhabditis remanei]|uniref:ShKT domain-containing protein n=1 Tax=Caenorhabditis remanei TaxID=31234 RepID=A0A6A5GG60_CAERE|nr:hypothetical protein GCK72_020192 [Caenorhabditis remanei]KAF1753635.1 hypothetical protein GCK72_020192 [Caenorhabditis remanei]
MLLQLFCTFQLFLTFTNAQITHDLNCSTYSPSSGYIYTWRAVSCSNVLSDYLCELYYPSVNGYPEEGSNASRPIQCYTPGISSAPANGDAKTVAIAYCPKTCGYCCETPKFNCQNKNQRLPCHTITKLQCESPNWRDILADDCASTCGLCPDNTDLCNDLNPDCANAPEVCTNPRMEDFVNKYCRKTCNRCFNQNTSTTSKPSIGK